MHCRQWLFSFFFLHLVVSISPAQTPKRPQPKPNVILITLDTTRADRMGFLGSDRGLTPNLDALAKQGSVFSRAYSQVPLTGPSHASLLTGTYPQFNRVNDFGAPLGPELPYLPELLHQQGYKTAAFVGSLVLDPKAGTAPGFDRGFDLYDANYRSKHAYENRYDTVERRAEDVVGHAIAWLKKRPAGGPFFIWVHLYDPHVPYDSPEPFRSRFSDPYDGEIAYADAMLGQLFAVLQSEGLYDGSLIALMSDHGEALGEHGESMHGIFLYDETIHVPLLIKLPTASGGSATTPARIETRVGLVDVSPTILESADVAIPKSVQGQSLLPLLRAKNGASPAPDRAVYSENDYPHLDFGWSSLRSLRTGKYLYVEAPKRELYDQIADPKAGKNLALASPAIADTLNSQLETFRQSTASNSTGVVKADPQMASKLAALGYVSGGTNAGQAGVIGGVDPKDRIEIANLLHNGLRALDEGDLEVAIKDLEQAIQAQPTSATAFGGLGEAFTRLKQYDKALPFLQKAVELKPDAGMNEYKLGLAFFQTGKVKESVVHFEAAVKAFPEWTDGLYSLATVYLRTDRREDTITTLDRTLKVDPNYFRANLLRGTLLVEDRPSEALVNLEKAAAEQPSASEPHFYMAKAYELIGNTAKAADEQRRAEELQGQR
jgi:arylsulfatase A-like enzyme/Tfp pilus assembly protein PilF